MTFDLMMMFVPVILIVAVMKFAFQRTITWTEAGIQFGVAIVLVFTIWQIGLHSRMTDRQFLNGVVTSKDQVSVPCSHSYSCHCRRDRKGNQTCDTCYEHSRDYDWMVYTNAIKGSDGQFEIERVDRQGAWTPDRWAAVRIGEPVALERSFDNYIMASPDSVYHTKSNNKALPKYPSAYDYSHADRVLVDGVTIPDLPVWNQRLTEVLSVLGPTKQSNVIIVFTKSPSAQFATDLRNAWLGGKKNDTVVVIGTPNYPQIAWADVFSWSKSDMLNVALRNDLTELKVVDREKVLGLVQGNVTRYFVRRPMEDYAYLRASIEPTPGFQIFGWILSILLPLGLGIYFHLREDGDIGISGRSSYRRY